MSGGWLWVLGACEKWFTAAEATAPDAEETPRNMVAILSGVQK